MMVAASAVRFLSICQEYARRKKAAKRGGDRKRVTFEGVDAIAINQDDMLTLDTALEKLEQHDPLAAKLVELRSFAGRTMPEAAELLDISVRTAERNWNYANAWLHAELVNR